MKDLRNQIVLITAQAVEYVYKIGGGDHPNLVTEKGMVTRVFGVQTRLPPPPEVAGFITEMDALLKSLSYPFVFNHKTAGYAVGFENNVPADQKRLVVDLINKQARNKKFIVEPTAGFVDITLKDLSKTKSLQTVMQHGVYRGLLSIAAGDSANTDGPMLDAATRGIMVTNPYKDYAVVPEPDDMIKILEWFRAVCETDE